MNYCWVTSEMFQLWFLVAFPSWNYLFHIIIIIIIIIFFHYYYYYYYYYYCYYYHYIFFLITIILLLFYYHYYYWQQMKTTNKHFVLGAWWASASFMLPPSFLTKLLPHTLIFHISPFGTYIGRIFTTMSLLLIFLRISWPNGKFSVIDSK